VAISAVTGVDSCEDFPGRVSATSATLNVKAGWPVTRISPRIEFKIVLSRALRIEPDDNFLVQRQLPFGELSGLRFSGKVFAPTTGHTMPPRIAEVVRKRCVEIVSAG